MCYKEISGTPLKKKLKNVQFSFIYSNNFQGENVIKSYMFFLENSVFCSISI